MLFLLNTCSTSFCWKKPSTIFVLDGLLFMMDHLGRGRARQSSVKHYWPRRIPHTFRAEAQAQLHNDLCFPMDSSFMRHCIGQQPLPHLSFLHHSFVPTHIIAYSTTAIMYHVPCIMHHDHDHHHYHASCIMQQASCIIFTVMHHHHA